MLRTSALALAMLSASASAAPTLPKNVIFFIGDGMGPAYTTAYRYYQADSEVGQVAPTVFDRLMLGSASTFPHDDTVVTDSAASATALATGVKSYNGAIGVDEHKQPLDSMLVEAKRLGWQTGIVSTSQVNHATPASFVAHAELRSQYDLIAEQFYSRRLQENQPLVDVILGGGQKYFPMGDGGLGQSMLEWGYQYTDSLTTLDSLTRTPAMGLFADKGLEYAIDSNQPHRLSAMVSTALRLFEGSQQPFFMLVEGSEIDWCGHGNDIACAMKEMDDFAKALEVAETYAKRHGDTLVVFTADHSTGGLTLGNNGEYQWDAKVVKQVNASLPIISKAIINQSAAEMAKTLTQYVEFAFTEQELARLASLNQDNEALYWALSEIISDRSFTGWTTSGHDAIDVPVGAMGPQSQRFIGHHDNIDLSKQLTEIIQAQR
ncbi:alkaline phosphatase [Ferrimonas sp. SCSIO 43195]|uniref:alkaline phosphatase n=1 Tax=Ferrimonas sp. SCSIO 43195 TaxID=2822844 RepID=UPI0020764D08|nr:alkaline phosphatase [Ferrimonas sp. SCSIO 43195]USD39505.1 alkaline phosphatase [Ferrimonas sp. SCSIO 43195]